MKATTKTVTISVTSSDPDALRDLSKLVGDVAGVLREAGDIVEVTEEVVEVVGLVGEARPPQARACGVCGRGYSAKLTTPDRWCCRKCGAIEDDDRGVISEGVR